MKKILKIVLGVVLALVVLATFYGLWKQSQPAPTVYDVVTPQLRDITKKTVATGTLIAKEEVDLKPQITGIITELHVVPGQTVKMGDVVAVIRVIPDMSQLTSAQNQVESAIIDLQEVQREAVRSQRLFDKGAISREENEQEQNRLASAKDKVAAAKALVEVITKGSSKRAGGVNTTQVYATMNGLVIDVPVKVGTSVSGSSQFSQGTTICTVADMSKIIFDGNIDETEVAKLRTGMEAQLVPGSMSDVKIPAVLDYISPKGELTNGSRTFEIKATAQVPYGVTIRSGYSVNAYFTIGEAKHVLSVDETCVEFSGDSTFVYKLTSPVDKKDKQKWQRTQVTLGLSDGIYVEVKSGITASDRIRGNKQ